MCVVSVVCACVRVCVCVCVSIHLLISSLIDVCLSTCAFYCVPPSRGSLSDLQALHSLRKGHTHEPTGPLPGATDTHLKFRARAPIRAIFSHVNRTDASFHDVLEEATG